jgi:transcriptional regulator with XRE-family HTH domain
LFYLARKAIFEINKFLFMSNSSKTLGQELKQQRELKGFSLRQVETLTKISNAYISQLENNKIKSPSVNTLYKLANFYGVDFSTLLEAGGVVKSKDKESERKSLAGFALSSDNLTVGEEEELIKYLKYLRFQKKNENK